MAKKLVLVESPAKVKTIGKFLRKNEFVVHATMGHVIDLPRSSLGVDVEKDFEPRYVVIASRKKMMGELKKAAEGKKCIYLATDPDREGEAIGWHLANRLGEGKKIVRVEFNELTREAVQQAFASPGELDPNKVNAQQARRILDRIVGYKLSPLLWKKVRRGLSAGRVQSVTLRFVVERERAIEKFVAEEYWEIEAVLESPASGEKAGGAGKEVRSFRAKLEKIEGKKTKIRNNEKADEILKGLEKEDFIVTSMKEEKKRRFPAAPFTTSKLQQEAFNRLRFSAGRTMRIAQSLYEGVELGKEGSVGLITYMRTDSVRVSESALKAVRQFIEKKYGKEYLLPSPRRYKSRKGAQEAHEAIRPTDVNRVPESVKDSLSADEYKLYRLIWARFVASQMNPETRLVNTVEISAGSCLFLARGSRILFDGFNKVYGEIKRKSAKEKAKEKEKEKERQLLPVLHIREKLRLLELLPSQHFTQPPARYSDATLVKELEDRGIGRPSTYAPIIQTIVFRNYVERKEGYLTPTELGKIVVELLVEYFPDVLDAEFTARLEEDLDGIENGEKDWIGVLREFYRPFDRDLKNAVECMRNIKKEQEVKTDVSCEKCGKQMVVRMGRWGRFLACSGFPKCRNTKPVKETPEGEFKIVEEETVSETCEKCGQSMVAKWGKSGKFLACSNYPECKTTKSITTGVKCPGENCGGELVRRRSRKGRFFYGCSNYPDCKFVANKLPEEKAEEAEKDKPSIN